MDADATVSTRPSDLTRTGDIWIFRGRVRADRAIQTLTNSPVNHVGMSLVIEDLPPLMWHAELGRSLPDMWSGKHQRGVQLHDLRDAVAVWAHRYGQRAWLRQLDPPVDPEMEDAVAAHGRPARRHAVPVHRAARLALAARPGAAIARRAGRARPTRRWRPRTAPRSSR